jgi:hypothetical protein
MSSSEIRGRSHPANPDHPCIRAYTRRLHPGERGIIFTTPVSRDPRFSAPHEVRWYFPLTAGVKRRANAQGEQVAAIPAAVTDLQS